MNLEGHHGFIKDVVLFGNFGKCGICTLLTIGLYLVIGLSILIFIMG